MSRSYNGVRLKSHRVYTVDDLMRSYGVSRNTITNWIKSGLNPSDAETPRVFRGAVISDFHTERRERMRLRLRDGEFKCVSCKMAVYPERDTIHEGLSNKIRKHLTGQCPDCQKVVSKLVSVAEFELVMQRAIPNTSRDCAHEEKRSVPAGIGNRSKILGTVNDRLLYRWQHFAGKYSEKTMDRHLSAIRTLEAFLDDQSFTRLSIEDVSRFRERLKASLSGAAGKRSSKSTVQHTTSHVRDFLTWLLKQEGYRRLPKDLPEYLTLPKEFYAVSIQRDARAYPRIEEAAELLEVMADKTLLQKRKRAIFALAFLGALRADTLVSLQVQHVDVARRRILQDGRASRTKNGKSFEILWFPIPDIFGAVVSEWVEVLTAMGARPEDALFPAQEHLQKLQRLCRGDEPPIASMTSTHAVSQSFAQACEGHHTAYTPHAAKHTIAAERDKRQLTHEQRKAWSENMGHENEQITDTHYGKLTDTRRIEVLETVSDAFDANPFDGVSDADLGSMFRQFLRSNPVR